MQPAFSSQAPTGLIGAPLSTVSCFIVDPAVSSTAEGVIRILPRGQTGELVVGGHQLATGYVNRPEQTSAAFLSTPYGRVYRTGDKARLRNDGTIECLGRLSDGQVKLRGQRIELGEVEQAILRTSGCRGAVSAVVGSTLVAFCAVDSGVAEEALSNCCEEWLSSFMVPGEFVLMKELPRLPSGKVDKKKLRNDYEMQRLSSPGVTGTVLDPVEEEIIGVVAQSLEVQVHLQTTLSAAGVDSLQAIKLSSSLRRAGFPISTTAILKTRNISDLCSSCMDARSRVSLEETNGAAVSQVFQLTDLNRFLGENPSLRQVDALVSDIVPCTPLQSAMLARTMCEERAYCNQIQLEVSRGFSAVQVLQAFERLVESHVMLRSAFSVWDGSFVILQLKSLPRSRIRIVESWEREFTCPSLETLLTPFRVQIRDHEDQDHVHVLIHIHHALYDGWTMDLIRSDLSDLLRGRPVKTRETFAIISKFYRSPLRQRMDEDARAFWAEHLHEWLKTPFPKLIGRRLDPDQIISTRLEIGISPFKVDEFASSAKCTAQCIFQAAIAVAWKGILGSSDVVLGTATSGRTIPVVGVETIIGPCVASLPMRLDLDRMNSWVDIFSTINSRNQSMMQHCTLPLAEIKKMMKMDSEDSLYDVLFVYQESLESRNNDTHLVKETWHLDYLETYLLLEVEPTANDFTIQATFHSSIIPPKMVSHVMSQIKDLVRHMSLQGADARFRASIEALDSERSVYNQHPRSLKDCNDLAYLFQRSAMRNPDELALRVATRPFRRGQELSTISYKDLNSEANQIAHYLRACGCRPGTLIAIMMEKSIHLYASILGILKAGCAYLPLLPTTPVSRVEKIFQQAKIDLCLIDAGNTSSDTCIQDTRFLKMDGTSWKSFADANVDVDPDPSRLAYVIYTSGTTGEPKGVAITHHNIVSNVLYLASTYPTSSRDKSCLLQACSQAFDVSVFEIFYAWCTGMCLCSATNDVLFGDIELTIRQLGVTHLSLTPTVASLVDPQNVPRVEFLVTAGEAMTRAVLDKWGDMLWQGYGPSETTNICSVKKMSHGDYVEHLGWVFPNTSAFVLNPDSLSPLPLGWVGELCFGGDQIGQGYCNLPRLTTEKFIDTPEYGRIYRSGDLGRMLPDGSLVILGRLDDQIKLRGQRIQASEIDTIVTSSGYAIFSATMLRKMKPKDHLVSFYVPKEGQDGFHQLEVDPDKQQAIFATIASHVPSYMIPSYLVPISQVPRTPSGKADWRALQDLLGSLSNAYLVSASNFVETTDDNTACGLESHLIESISRSLQMPTAQIGRWTPFAALGLDSITAIRVSRDLGSFLGMQVPISSLLQNASVAQLAQFLEGTPNNPYAAEQQTLPDDFFSFVRHSFGRDLENVEDILPCTPLQEAMLSTGPKSFYNKTLFRLHASPSKMKGWWTKMSERHGILRTCFVTTEVKAYAIAQIILRDWVIPWVIFDASAQSVDAAVEEHLSTLPDPLDTHIPPISMAVIEQKDSKFLSFICHHAMYDGVAMQNLLREVQELANDRSLEPPVAYKPVIQMMLSLPEDTTKFWSRQFRGFKPTLLFAKTIYRSLGEKTISTKLDVSLEGMQSCARSLGVSFLSLCQATWANVIAIAGGTEDVCFGNVVSGRTLDVDGIERLVAPCFNTIPIRRDLSAGLQNIEVARYFQHYNQILLRYQFTPLRLIQKLVRSSEGSLFDTLLLLQQPVMDTDQSVWTLEGDSGNMGMPLICEILPHLHSNSVIVNMHHDMAAIPKQLATLLGDLFESVLKDMMYTPFAKLKKRESLPNGALSVLPTLNARRDNMEILGGDHMSNDSWTDMELNLRQAMSDLSGIPSSRIQRSTTIHQVGLDSIDAVQLASKMRKSGLAISGSDVMECLTPMKIAQRGLACQQTSKASHRSYNFHSFSEEVKAQVAEKILIPDVEAVLPCTPLQSAMLTRFLQTNGKDYLNLLCYNIDGGIDHQTLVDAWKQVQSRQPMLRSGFVSVRHRDSTFAMVRYRSSFSGLTQVEVGEAINRSQWKIDAAKSICSRLELPPFRISINYSGGHRSMSLLIHHALYDAISLNAILHDLSTFIKNHDLPPPPRIELALGRIMCRSLSQPEESQGFWKSLARKAVVNPFPVLTSLKEGSRRIETIEGVSYLQYPELRGYAADLNASVQAIVQAAWTRVLAAYVGEDSVVFGVTLSGRDPDEIGEAPFPCFVTLPVIASNELSDRELVRSMDAYNASMHRYQFAPLSHIQKWLGHPAQSVFDTLLVFQRRETMYRENLPWKLAEDEAVVEYPVSLEVEHGVGNTIRLCITYFSDVLPPAQAQIMMDQFNCIFRQIASNPQQNRNDLVKTSPELFSVMPPETSELPSPVSYLHQFVERHAMIQPRMVALEYVSGFDGSTPITQTWSYQELNCMGNRVANVLRSRTQPGGIVALHFNKCPEAYFSILGILKVGCSFIALDHDAPTERKEFIMCDSGASCLLFKDLDEGIFKTSAELIRISTEGLQMVSDEPVAVEIGSASNTRCYCLYTSGTTGTPKGCEITHENAVQAMMAFQQLFKGRWNSESRWIQFAALHFDVSVLEQYWSWSVGITVVAAPRDLILDDLTAAINRMRITHIDLTPSLASLIKPHEVPGLCNGVFVTGGEQLKQDILDAWGSKGVIYNAYGPTEATIGVTAYAKVPNNGRPENIGKQFANVGTYVILPGAESPVLRGGCGELCVSGKLVGKGYLNRPDLTEERFPTLVSLGARVYRTGDMVRLLHDGCFEFLGRADEQVKLRGQRLEVGEINHVTLARVPDIEEMVTIVTRHTSSGREVLVSFMVGERVHGPGNLCVLPDDAGLGDKARAACCAQLPGYMVPTYFLRLPYIPLSTNNKVDTKALKAVFSQLASEQLVELTAPRETVQSRENQEHIRRIIKTLAKFCNVATGELSETSSIFDLGIDSISVLQLSTRMKTEGFTSCSPSVLLKSPTVADLATVLRINKPEKRPNRRREAEVSVQACSHRYTGFVCKEFGIDPNDIEYIAPCSPLQQGIISRAMVSRNEIYFNTFEMRLDSKTSIRRLRRAWNELFTSAPVLRTRFINTTSGCIQVSLRNNKLQWRQGKTDGPAETLALVDSTRISWMKYNKENIMKPFEILAVQEPNRARVFVFIFHAIYDGTSFDAMMHWLSLFYANQPTLTAPSFLEALLNGPLSTYEDCREFWYDHLKQWSHQSLHASDSSSQESTVRATKQISGQELEKVSKVNKVTLQAVILAIWTATLHENYQNALTTGVVVSGRSIDLAGVENTIGPLFNTIPFFTESMQKHTWKTLLLKCHEFHVSTLPFQHVPLSNIQKWCSAGKPLFDNIFTFQVERREGNESSPWQVLDEQTHPDYPLGFEATFLRTGDMRLSIVAKIPSLDSRAAEGLLKQFERNAGIISNTPGDFVTKASTTREKSMSESAIGKGHHLSPCEPADGLVWTPDALVLRQALAFAGGIPADTIKMQSTILELGLDSIDVLKLSASLRKSGFQLAPSKIMQTQSILRLVGELEVSPQRMLREKEAIQDLQLKKQQLWNYVASKGWDMEAIETVLPCSALQESMIAHMQQSGFQLYFNHDVLQIADHVDLNRLRIAWIQVVKQSTILRARFLEVDSPDLSANYCQVVSRTAELTLDDVYVNDTSECRRLIAEATHKAQVEDGKTALFQVRFARTQEHRFVVLSIAHALYDGWSLDLMYQDLHAAYMGHKRHRNITDWCLAKLLSCDSSQSREFWANHLSGATPTLLHKSDDSEADKTLHRHEYVSTTGVSKIKRFCQKLSISLQSLCAAGWAIWLAHRTRSLVITFGTVFSGRDFESAEEMMFPTINTAAVHFMLHGSVSGFLSYVEETLTDIRRHQRFPLGKALAASHNRGQVLFNSLFIFQKSIRSGYSGDFLKSLEAFSAVEYPVCVEAEVADDRLIWRAACQGEFLSDSETRLLVKQLDETISFFQRHECPLLDFYDSQVSIGGLFPVTLRDATPWKEENITQELRTKNLDKSSEVIRSILGILSGIPLERIPLNQTIFGLGLDSISVIKVSALLRNEKVFIKPRDLLKAGSIPEMAKMTEQNGEGMSSRYSRIMPWSAPVDLEKFFHMADVTNEEVEALLPATSMQVHMVSVWQNSEGSVLFPEFRYRVEGVADEEQVYTAWKTLVLQTPILRTLLVATGSSVTPLLQVILKRQATHKRFFGPGAQALARLRVTRDGSAKDIVATLRIHHAIYDGASLDSILHRFASLLNGKVIEEHKPHKWAKYIIREARPEAAKARDGFWRTYLANCSLADAQRTLPVDASDRVSFVRPEALSDMTRLRKCASQHQFGVQSLFLAVYAQVLAGQRNNLARATSCVQPGETVVFGLYLANLADAYEEELPDTFPSLRLVPLRVQTCRSGRSLIDVASAIQGDIAAISCNRRADIGLWQIREQTGIQLTSFVNFLGISSETRAKFPEPSSVNSQASCASSMDDTISLKPILEASSQQCIHLGNEKGSRNSAIRSPQTSWDLETLVVGDNHVREAYPV